jgi:hypothetical protein
MKIIIYLEKIKISQKQQRYKIKIVIAISSQNFMSVQG